MNSAICTLFEGHYHYGVATLSNSLYNNGFRGTIYVGYRGELPNWVLKGKRAEIGNWEEVYVSLPINGLQLIFLKLSTTYSLTNYKPNFMLELWDGPAKDADALFYFDPDIVINDSWTCFEEWVNCGVALCEDVNSPIQEYHPRRRGWKSYYKNHNIELRFKNQIYVNGGFVGVHKKDVLFLNLWMQLQESMGPAIGGLENSIFSKQTYESTILKMKGFQIFDKSDQDALNATIEAFEGRVSYLGKEGMGFVSGKSIMLHALGANKPWHINFILKSLDGRPPNAVHECYWKNASYPILAHSEGKKKRKQMAIFISKLLGRFYKV